MVVVITSDGMENASRRYRYSDVKRIVEQHTELGWEFLFFGANIDAVETAGKVGIVRERAANFHADSRGIGINYEAVAETICHLREDEPVTAAWKKSIDTDFTGR